MKTAYLDAFSGLSGDMIVGAILDCGADFAEFERAITQRSVKPTAGFHHSHLPCLSRAYRISPEDCEP